MNAFAIQYVNAHVQYLLEEAADRRTAAKLPKRSNRQRLASIAGNIRSTFSSSMTAQGSVLSTND